MSNNISRDDIKHAVLSLKILLIAKYILLKERSYLSTFNIEVLLKMSDKLLDIFLCYLIINFINTMVNTDMFLILLNVVQFDGTAM